MASAKSATARMKASDAEYSSLKETSLQKKATRLRFFHYALFASAFLSRGLVQCLNLKGVYLLEFQQEFNISAAIAGWLTALPDAILGIIGLPTGVLLRYFSCERVGVTGAIIYFTGVFLSSFATSIIFLFVTFTIIGIGGGMLYTATIVVVQKQFRGHFALMYSFISIGSAIGKTLSPPLIRFLIYVYGWRGALLVEAAILSHCIVAALHFKPKERISEEKTLQNNVMVLKETTDTQREQNNGLKDTGNNSSSIQDVDTSNGQRNTTNAMKDYSPTKGHTDKSGKLQLSKQTRKSMYFCFVPSLPVWIITSVYLFQLVGSLAVVIFGVAKAEEEDGVDFISASLVLSIFGLGGIFGRILNGVVIDRGWLSPIGVEITMSAFICTIAFISNANDGYAMLMTIAACQGFTFAFLHTVLVIVVKEVDDPSRFSINLGFAHSVSAIGQIAGGYLMGFVRDVTGNYAATFYVAGGSFLLAVILSIILYFLERGRKSRNSFPTNMTV
ncbi:monocarboxylate transporter 14-like isoform X2 [Amphiura filiformis]